MMVIFEKGEGKMIDTHSHILPFSDDGAGNWEESIAMATEAAKEGINIIVATPHHHNGLYYNDRIMILDRVNLLNQKLKIKNINVSILPGQEIHVYDNYLKDLQEGKLLSINNNKKYVYLEFPLNNIPKGVEQLIFDIQVSGYIPIIPHPEKNQEILEKPLKLYNLVKKGALTQITTSSLLGLFGKEIHRFTLKLIDNNLTHLLATDAHQVNGNRSFNLSEAYKALSEYGGSGLVDKFKKNAEMIVLGKDIYVDEPNINIIKKKLFGIY